MKNFEVRRFKDSDVLDVIEIIKKDLLTENIKDYTIDYINNVIKTNNDEVIIERSKMFHAYVVTCKDKIVGIGMIGPYWDSLTESSLFTIFIDPDFKGQGVGRLIMETLEKDEFYKRALRVEIPASITALNFYRHFGYGFKKFGNIVDSEGHYKLEKYTDKSIVKCNLFNIRPYIDNEYHDHKKFISLFGLLESDGTWIIELNGLDIGIYVNKRLYLLDDYKNLKMDIINEINSIHGDNVMKKKYLI